MRNVLFCLVFGLLALSALALPYIATEELVEVDDQPVEVVRTARSPHYGFGRRYGGYGGGYGGYGGYHRPRPHYGGYGGYGRPYGGYGGGGFGGSASYANAGSSSFGGGFGGGSSSFANAGSVSGGFYG